MGEEVKDDDLNVFVNCTPLFDDIEWEPQLVARRVAMGLQLPTPRNDNPLLSQEPPPPLLMVAEQLPQEASEPLQATENSGVNESTINISSPNAPERVEVGWKRRAVVQKTRPGRPKSKNDDPLLSQEPRHPLLMVVEQLPHAAPAPLQSSGVNENTINISSPNAPESVEVGWKRRAIGHKRRPGRPKSKNDDPLLSQESRPPLLMVAEQLIQATENSKVNESTINISSPTAPERVEVGRKRRAVGQKRRPGRPKSKTDDPVLSQAPRPPLLMVAEQLTQAAPEPLQATENSGVHESTVNISSPNAPERVEVGSKRRAVEQKRRPGRPKSNNDDPPSWLPPNWTVCMQIRHRGASAGHVDKYYYSPEGRKLRSRSDVEAYLCRTNAKVCNLKMQE